MFITCDFPNDCKMKGTKMDSGNQVEVLDASPEDDGIFLTKKTYEGLKKKAAETDIFYDRLLNLEYKC